jgi:hypothetical protein
MTKDADRSWHHGLTAPSQAEASNPLSRWIDQGVVSLGFQGRLSYRPPSKFPIRPSEQPPARHAKSMKAIAQGKTVPSRH